MLNRLLGTRCRWALAALVAGAPLLWQQPAAAQTVTIGQGGTGPQAKPSRMTVAYFGESVTNAGATVGYEAAFYYRRPHELLGAAHIGGYNNADPAGYGLFLYLEGGYRINTAIGFFIEGRVGLGYVNVNRSGGVEMQPDGSSVATPNVSTNYLMPIGLAGVGWDLLPRAHVPLSLFSQVGGMGRYNQAEPFSGGLIFTAGLAYQFGTGKPRTAELPVPSPPIPVAPTVPDAAGAQPAAPPPAPYGDQPPGTPPAVGPAEPAPPDVGPGAPPPGPAGPIAPAEPTVPPALPPPTTAPPPAPPGHGPGTTYPPLRPR